MAKILIVEDDEFFTVAVQQLLEAEGHSVLCAENGKMAIYQLETNTVDCILSDVQMPVLNGIELAKWVKNNRPEVPCILMTGYSDMIDTLDATAKGAVNLLYKPFSNEDLFKTIAQAISKKPVAAKAGLSYEGFAKIPTRSLLNSPIAEFDLYVEQNGQLQKVISRGEPLSACAEVLSHNAYLFTELSSLETLIPMNLMASKAVSKVEGFDPVKKSQIIQQSVELIYEKIGSTGLDEKAFSDSIEFLQCCMQAMDDSAIWNLISHMQKASNPVYSSGMISTALTVMLTQAKKFSAEYCFKAATAALFHDIGMLQMDPAIVYKAPVRLTMKERNALEKHVDLSVAALRKIPSLPEEIIEIVSQHHENCVGTGYPNKLKRVQIHPIARILYVADEFCMNVIKSPGHPGMVPANAVELMQNKAEFDFDTVETLAQLLKPKKEKASA